MPVYFVNVRDLSSGYLFEDFCATFASDDPDYGTAEAAFAAAEICYTETLAMLPADEYEVMFLSFS